MDISISSSSISSRYSVGESLGNGKFATVYLAYGTEKKPVAIKKIEGEINRSALREIKLLKELDHINIVKLLDIFVEDRKSIYRKESICLVFEFMTSNLENVIKNVEVLEIGHIKNISIQVLQGLGYLHSKCVLHRDLKPNNIFVGSDGVVKIGDFEFVRPIMTEPLRVMTRRYRSPELLLSMPLCCIGVDLWSVGCIIAEMFLGKPLFVGNSDYQQLDNIFQVTGMPTEDMWPDFNNICRRTCFTECHATPYKQIFADVSDEGIDLLSTLLSLNPIKRGTCTKALQHPYFASEPRPCYNSELPLTKETCSPPCPANQSSNISPHLQLEDLLASPLPWNLYN